MKWNEALQLEGNDLLNVILRRLKDENFGPTVDDRSGESPLAVFVELTKQDADFAFRLECAFRYFLLSKRGIDPNDIILFDAAFSIMMMGENLDNWQDVYQWWVVHQQTLFENERQLARAALGALASMPHGEETLSFWYSLLRDAPDEFMPRVFIGIRRVGFAHAIYALPKVFKRAKEANQNPEALLYGLYQQSPKETIDWLKTALNSYDIIRKFITDEQRAEIEKCYES